jgi:hypothetical protein
MRDALHRNKLRLSLAAVAIGGLLTAGCADLSPTEQRTATGALGGAAAGGIIGALAGHTPAGLLLGAAAGAGGGYLYSAYKNHEQAVYDKGVADGRSGG